MKKPLTVRVDPDLLDAARACATREHRTLTNFIEMSLRDRIDALSTGGPTPRSPASLAQERSARGP